MKHPCGQDLLGSPSVQSSYVPVALNVSKVLQRVRGNEEQLCQKTEQIESEARNEPAMS